MKLADVEAVIWSQARNLNSADDLIRKSAMDVVRAVVASYAEDRAGPIVAARRRVLHVTARRRAS